MPASGTAKTLPGGRNSAGIAIEDTDIEGADIDTEFQCRGGDDAVETALA